MSSLMKEPPLCRSFSPFGNDPIRGRVARRCAANMRPALTPKLSYWSTSVSIGLPQMETEPPADPAEMIEEYFSEVLETFEILENPVSLA
jgi:hypothetical protein